MGGLLPGLQPLTQVYRRNLLAWFTGLDNLERTFLCFSSLVNHCPAAPHPFPQGSSSPLPSPRERVPPVPLPQAAIIPITDRGADTAACMVQDGTYIKSKGQEGTAQGRAKPLHSHPPERTPTTHFLMGIKIFGFLLMCPPPLTKKHMHI